MKICNKCKIEKLETEFYKDSHTPSGIRGYCKDCGREMRRIYRESHKDEIREYYYKNRELRELKPPMPRKARALTPRMPKALREKMSQQEKIEKERARCRAKYHKTKHSQKYISNKRKRARARYRNLKGIVSSVTVEQINKLIEDSNNICFWCDQHTDKIHLDHVYPLSKGGGHTISNIVVSCKSCNLHKQAKDPEIWLEEILN